MTGIETAGKTASPSRVHVEGVASEISSSTPRVVLASLAYACYTGAAILGLAGMAGWLLDIQVFRVILPGLASMKLNTALCMLLLAAAGLARVDRQGSRLAPLAKLLAGVILTISLLTLLQYATGADLGIDQWFVEDRGTSPDAFPGRMSLATALCFFALGLAKLARATGRYKLSQLMAGATFVVSLLALFAYILDYEALYSFSFFSSMALHTALGILLLSIGILLMNSDTGFLAVFYRMSHAGSTARHLLPAAALIPLFVSWLVLAGQSALGYNARFGIILCSIISAVLLIVAIYLMASRLQKIEQEKRRLEIQQELQTEQLAEIQRARSMGMVAGGLAHDFNNLLLPIRWAAEMGQSGLSGDDPKHKQFQTIQKAVDKATNLANRMMDLGKQKTEKPELIDVNAVIREFLEILRGVAKGRADIRTELDDRVGSIVAVKQQFEQVLLNLVSNGCHAIQAKARKEQGTQGEIVIRTCLDRIDQFRNPENMEYCRPGDYVRLSVTDNGIGMSEEVRRQAVEPFFSTREKGGGHGLGLATVMNIALQHHGCLQLESEPGRGSTFALHFPLRILAMIWDNPNSKDGQQPVIAGTSADTAS